MHYAMRDGVRLAYEEAGSGSPILLVHGMRCDHRHMTPLFDHLSRGHRVVNVDLRAHGMSDAPHSAYTNDVFADDLLWLADHLGLDRPVVIGHSFGGSVSLHLATIRPEIVGGLVLLDTGVRTTAEKEAEMGRIIANDGGAVDPEENQRFLADRLFGPDDDPVLRDEILALMATTPEHASLAMGQAVLDFDSATAAIACSVPALLILADRPFTTPAMIARLGPTWRVAQVVGAGHFVQLFAADQVNPMVDRFLTLIGR